MAVSMNMSDGRVLLAKKLGGLLAIILGCLLAASGIAAGSAVSIVLGVLLLALGVVLLTLKIVTRNQQSSPR
jgi:uncharacterized membrane protein HdeD (DUF308 family)